MTGDQSNPDELNIFCKGGATHAGLDQAQEFFENFVPHDGTIDSAFTWLVEEVGELSRIIRGEDTHRYKDGIGDIIMWTFTLARLLDVQVSESLDYSIKQLVAKGYTKLPAVGKIDPPADR